MLKPIKQTRCELSTSMIHFILWNHLVAFFSETFVINFLSVAAVYLHEMIWTAAGWFAGLKTEETAWQTGCCSICFPYRFFPRRTCSSLSVWILFLFFIFLCGTMSLLGASDADCSRHCDTNGNYRAISPAPRSRFVSAPFFTVSWTLFCTSMRMQMLAKEEKRV